MPQARSLAAAMQLVLTLSAIGLGRAQQLSSSGQWVESFRAETGKSRQTTLQIYGTPVAISDDGSVIAVGCEKTMGVWDTRIYAEDPATPGRWDLQATVPRSGFSISLSSDGSKAALGDIDADNHNGRVIVMARQPDGTWAQEGADITPEPGLTGVLVGYSVGLSGDGGALIVGTVRHPGGGTRRGRAEIYELVGGEWQSVYALDGDSDNALLGHAVAMSRDGTAALASGELDGKVYTLELGPGGAWQRNVETSPSGDPATEFGNSLAISADGSVRAIGAWKDVMHLRRGRNGRVAFSSATALDIRPDLTFSYPNGMFGASVSVSGDGGIVAVGTNSFLGGIYVYAWDAQAEAWSQLPGIPVSTVGAPGKALALSASGSRLLYVERGSRQVVVADFQP